ncbi:MAG: bis(5'-nucleosyl)-tetraphosphatase, partial [Candidatus Thermoplasmatota archaeon]|nr:bis(5'-nucleosyl)-tetraphosphatase [Candidatus Thermoplasmatota archaeon]
MIEEKSCGAVIFREEGEERKYLLLLYKEGHWEFVKGHVKQGEADRETVLREIREETGMTAQDVEIINGFKEPVTYFYEHQQQLMRKTVTYYLAKTEVETIQLSTQEHEAYQWLNYSDAYKRLSYKNSKQVLEKAQQFLAARPPAAPKTFADRDIKREYLTAKDRKNMYLEMFYKYWKNFQLNALTYTEAGEDAFVQSILEFKFKLDTTVKRRDGNMGMLGRIDYQKWVEDGRKEKPDYYRILPNEIVMGNDYTAKEEVVENGKKVIKVNEEETWNNPARGQRVIANKIINALNRRRIPFILGISGGKGPHLHVFFALPDKDTIKRLNRRGITIHHLREFLFNKICDWAEIPEEFRTKGGAVDTACVHWTREHLVRCFGGRKFQEFKVMKDGAETTEWRMTGYKSLLTEIPAKKPAVTRFTEVKYPEKIEEWHVSKELLDYFISEFKPYSFDQRTVHVDFKGNYIDLPCINLARKTPVPEGMRNTVCQQIAFACILDGLP